MEGCRAFREGCHHILHPRGYICDYDPLLSCPCSCPCCTVYCYFPCLLFMPMLYRTRARKESQGVPEKHFIHLNYRAYIIIIAIGEFQHKHVIYFYCGGTVSSSVKLIKSGSASISGTSHFLRTQNCRILSPGEM